MVGVLVHRQPLGLFGAFGSSGFEGVALPLHIVVVPNVRNVENAGRWAQLNESVYQVDTCIRLMYIFQEVYRLSVCSSRFARSASKQSDEHTECGTPSLYVYAYVTFGQPTNDCFQKP